MNTLMNFEEALQIYEKKGETVLLSEQKELKKKLIAITSSNLNAESVLQEGTKEIGEKYLKMIESGTLALGKIILISSSKASVQVRKVLKPIYEFIRSFNMELREALNNENYEFKIIAEPELPDFDDCSEEEKSLMNTICESISAFLPVVVEALNVFASNKIPYDREIKILLNTLQAFLDKASKM